MPLTKTGKKVKRKMERHYGKIKGKRVFYALENKRKGLGKGKKRQVQEQAKTAQLEEMMHEFKKSD